MQEAFYMVKLIPYQWPPIFLILISNPVLARNVNLFQGVASPTSLPAVIKIQFGVCESDA